MVQSVNGTVTHSADKNHMLFHAHLLQNSHIKTEESFQLLGIWHIFSFQLVGIWHKMSFLISCHTANTVNSTLGFFFPAFPVKIIHSPLGVLAVTAAFHMQILSACCKETEEHPHIHIKQLTVLWNLKWPCKEWQKWTCTLALQTSQIPSVTKSCFGWLNYNDRVILVLSLC